MSVRRHTSIEMLSDNAPVQTGTMRRNKPQGRPVQSKIFDDSAVVRGYESVPLIDIDVLPRGGISFETKAVGRIQFGIPPETIKDSMLLGIQVPSVYIVPVERFCREMGPALGINLAEFEFPAYFNYFVRQKRCTLVIDSSDAEQDIRDVFGETLLGPECFRNHAHPLANIDEDFDPAFPTSARPNFYKEFYNFRTAEASTDYQELTIDTLLEFCHFRSREHDQRFKNDGLGVPPTPQEFEIDVGLSTSDGFPLGMTARRRHSVVTGTKLDTMDDMLGAIAEDNFKNSSPDVSRHEGGGSMVRSTSDPDVTSLASSSNNAGVGGSSSTISPTSSHGRRFSSTASPTSPLKPVKGPRRSSMPIQQGGGRRGSMGAVDSAGGPGRRDSMLSNTSEITPNTSRSKGKQSHSSSSVTPDYFLTEEEPDVLQDESNWVYSQVKWLGEVAVVYPTGTTEEEKRNSSTARVEIFKMAGGTEYIVHDVDKNNIIIGKARFSGTVRVPDELSVEGFICTDMTHGEEGENDTDEEYGMGTPQRSLVVTPTFHPPSFGVTVLGNSHGFDKNGSTSGYVLWVNGRGIMIDPPPYSSATLEREGIRPQMIMAIIITHCHADHDAGAFQKVMTGARVAIITTPTIYKSFIRKYSALSGLRPTLLKHSHRHRPAIVGQPLRFQGAVFHFTYTLHTIPCISFKVEWKGRSMVFTGDHLNCPLAIDSLQEKGILTKERADDLRRLPMQDCDLLLHEAGAPPIHTPLSVLESLPSHVKARLYVVHTAAIPAGSELRVAPTGTAGTIRLDRHIPNSDGNSLPKQGTVVSASSSAAFPSGESTSDTPNAITVESLQDGGYPNLTVLGNYDAGIARTLAKQFTGKDGKPEVAPLVFLRPVCISDAWFILYLLSAVPFLSSLSYAHTMEILEITQVEVYCAGEVVLERQRRPHVLCVFWEGACTESSDSVEPSDADAETEPIVWHAGDWTGPVSLQPDIARAGSGEKARDIVAISKEGVKVIVVQMKDLQRILKSGSKLFRKYLALKAAQKDTLKPAQAAADSLLEVIRFNSVLGNLTALQKRHLESLAEGPRFFAPGSLLWKIGAPVDFAYLLVSGTATLGSRAPQRVGRSRMNRRGSTGAISGSMASADHQHHGQPSNMEESRQFDPDLRIEPDKLLQNVHPNSEYARLEVTLQLRLEKMRAEMYHMNDAEEHRAPSVVSSKHNLQRTNHDRFANKVLARLYSRRAYTSGMVFSRGIFLSDTSRMVGGDLANIHKSVGAGTGTGGGGDHNRHTSNLMAGLGGCVVLIFPRATLVSFLDMNPGVLLGLLGTQVVV